MKCKLLCPGFEHGLPIPFPTMLTVMINISQPKFVFGLVSLFNGISTFLCYLMLLEEQQWCYLTHSWEDKGVYIVPKSICPKVNVIVRLEFELTYYNPTVHHFNCYTTRTPLQNLHVHMQCIEYVCTFSYTPSLFWLNSICFSICFYEMCISWSYSILSFFIWLIVILFLGF